MELLGLLAIVVILGALVGGNSLGETIRGGCGCFLVIIVVFAVIAFITGYWR
jgi:hypothetical protein